LVVAAHADDETLGCGGTIARHVSEGDTVHVMIMTNGVGARGDGDEKAIKERQEAFHKAMSILGVQKTYENDFPDNRMDTFPLLEITQSVEKVIKKIEPSIVYTHHYGDLNIDHQITHKAVITACRPIPQSSVKEIYSFEVLSSTEWSDINSSFFRANKYMDISNYIDVKLKAIDVYHVEMRSQCHSRSKQNVETLAKLRGFSVGIFAAEAFQIIRTIG
jgi:LmbE family N-acetylglucosaminyl deacetylase